MHERITSHRRQLAVGAQALTLRRPSTCPCPRVGYRDPTAPGRSVPLAGGEAGHERGCVMQRRPAHDARSSDIGRHMMSNRMFARDQHVCFPFSCCLFDFLSPMSAMPMLLVLYNCSAS